MFRRGEVQVGIAYRRLYADRWFVGTEVREDLAPFGQPLYLDINSLDFSVTYGVSDRVALTLTVPFSHGTHSRIYGGPAEDGARHVVAAGGLGDISLVGTAWLLDPMTHERGNVSLGIGLKAPTGNNRITDVVTFADSTSGVRTVDQSIQLGDGGWGVVLQAQAFQRVFSRTSAYLVAWYMAGTEEHTDVPSPYPGVLLAVPDVYSARGGLAYAVAPTAGLSASLGLRIDGIPMGDLLGGTDRYFRRPGYSLYADPGIALRRGNNEFILNMPVLVAQDFKRSPIDQDLDRRGGGDLADYLIFLGYNRRF
ncbi:MAG: hypothetical protein ACRDHY_09880 [Anaerolineales bacterium]